MIDMDAERSYRCSTELKMLCLRHVLPCGSEPSPATTVPRRCCA